MLICQAELIVRAILTEFGGIFYEIRGLKNDIEVHACPVHP